MTASVALASLVRPVKSWNPSIKALNDTILYIDIGAIDSAAKRITSAQTILGSVAPSRARQLVEANDVLVSTVRPNLNAVALVGPHLHGATASTGFCVLRAEASCLEPRYLMNWVKSPAFVSDLVRRATGASYPAVSERIILDSEIPLPSLHKQRRIAEILDRVEAVRAQRRQALAQLDALAQAIFLDMFGDPLSNPRGLSERLCLGEVADVVSGVTKGRPLKGQAAREVPYLAVSNVQDRHLNLESVKTIEATEAEITRYKLIAGDLLLTEGGDPDKLGRGTLWNSELGECIHQNHIFRVRITSADFRPLFLNWLVGSARGKRYFLRSAKQTTGIASINMTQLKKFPLLAPPVHEQHEFERRLGGLAILRSATERAASAENTLFTSLQYRAFRGEL